MTDRAAARLAWIVFAFVTLLMVAGVISSVMNASGENPSDASDVVGSIVFAVAMFTFPSVGALIASRHPRNAIGWILLAIGFVWETDAVSHSYVEYALATHPGSLPRPDLGLALSDWLWVPGVGLMGTFLILLFPDGRLPSQRWKPWAWLSALSLTLSSVLITIAPGGFAESGHPNVTNPLGVESLRPFESAGYAVILLIPVCIVGCAWSLVQRFRRSRGTERVQLKWLTAAAAASASVYLIAMVVSIPFDWSNTGPLWVSLVQNTALFSFVLIPLSAGKAILRHRLYDIDRIINRTLVYGAVSALLLLVYAGGVFGIGGVLRSVTGGESNNLAVAGSTLVVAALFSPFRTRVQTFIDRRFYRHKYDAAKMLQEFSTRMRDEVELDTLENELLATVNHALRPSYVSLWVRPQDPG